MLPRVQRIRRGDRVLCYHRPTGTRLPDLPETHPDFIAAWAAAEAQKPNHAPTVKAGSVSAIARALKTGKRWAALSPAYRRMMGRHLDGIITSYGEAPVRGLLSRHIEADLSKLDPNPANHRLKAWRLLMATAKASGAVDTDPARQVQKILTRTDGHATWTEADVTAYRARWPIGTVQRAAMELLAWTGARVSDAHRMTRAQIGADGVLTFRQVKTGGPAFVPWSCPLPDWATGWEAERSTMRESVAAVAGFTLLETAQGRARTAKGLSNLIRAAAGEAGIDGKSAHGLRKYRLTRIAEAGGSAHAIMAWGGHASLSEAEHYTRSAAKRALIVGREQTGVVVNKASGGGKRKK